MAEKNIIVVGAILALLASFFIIISMLTVPGDLYIGGNLNVSGSGEFGEDIDMNENYILYTDHNHWIHFTMEKGATDITINIIPSAMLLKDRHYHRLIFAIDEVPGDGQTASVSLSNGASTMTVSLTGDELADYTTTNEFDLDVSDEGLVLTYSQTAGGGATKGFVTIKFHFKENA